MTLNEEEVEVLREAIDCFLAKRPPKRWDDKKRQEVSQWDYPERRARAVAEELYSRLRLSLAEAA